MAADEITKLDKRLHRDAKRKIEKGERPKQDEAAAYRRVEKLLERENLWKSFGSVPKGFYQEMAGRPAQVLNKQAEGYGLPVGGRTVDVVAVIRWLHDMLGRHGQKIAPIIKGTDADADPRLKGAQHWQEAKLREETLKAQIEREQMEEALLPREDIHQFLTMVASRYRGALEQIQRCETGAQAYEVLSLAIEENEAEALRYFDDDRDEAA